MRKQLALAILAAALTAMSATPLYADGAGTDTTPPASEVAEDENESDGQQNPPHTQEQVLPDDFALASNYPNPFN